MLLSKGTIKDEVKTEGKVNMAELIKNVKQPPKKIKSLPVSKNKKPPG